MTDVFKNKVILVTGGTGSFGQQFVKTLLNYGGADKIIIFSRDELKQYEMMKNISDPEGRLRFFIGDVRDIDRLDHAFREVDYVVHAAALKQVPALEYNPFEAIKTNILGTKNVITAAIRQNVKKVILVSTDKAANPANLYGATKLCAEKLMVSANVYAPGGTCFSVVRYGNVLGSRGSLLQVVEKQKSTGEITLTHEDMTRFWITLDQGVALVCYALEHSYGGEIVIPKIPSMNVKDFIGFVAPGCSIKTVGIRPGEKLHESLVTCEESRNTYEDEGNYIILPASADERLVDKYKHLEKTKENFFYSSNNNTDWLNEDSLKDLLDTI
jgi:UDP-N-acetylglucosamine 4,6-dehydratase/5-epimerase